MTPILTPEQRQAIDDHKGEPVFVVDPDRHQAFVLVSAEEYQRIRALLDIPTDIDSWTEQKDARRRELIDKDIADSITFAERAELIALQHQANAHFDTVAPPPTDGARRLHERLLGRRDGQK